MLSKQTIEKLNESALIFKNTGDVKSYTYIYKTLHNPILAYVRNQLRKRDITNVHYEDVHSEIFLKVYDRIQKYENGNFLNWVYSIARNTILSFIRNVQYKKEIPFVDLMDDDGAFDVSDFATTLTNTAIDIASNITNVDFVLTESQYEFDMHELNCKKIELFKVCMDELPEKYKYVLHDRYLLGIKQVDISKYYGGTVSHTKYKEGKAISDLKGLYKRREQKILLMYENGEL